MAFDSGGVVAPGCGGSGVGASQVPQPTLRSGLGDGGDNFFRRPLAPKILLVPPPSVIHGWNER